MHLDQEYELVDVGRLSEHPQNPRRGDTGAIEESIEANGWYGAVTAQRSTGHILAGNHRYRVAKERGAKKVPTIWRDVDDETAIRILLADNRTADLGTYDKETLDELLFGLESLEGTGWGREPLAALEESLEGENGAGEGDGEVPDDVYTPSYGVIVVCRDEAHQEEVYEQLTEAGHEIRVIAV